MLASVVSRTTLALSSCSQRCSSASDRMIAAEGAALDLLGKSAERYVVKSKTVTAAGIELTAELRTRDASTAFVSRIAEIDGVGSASLVSYNGEYMS